LCKNASRGKRILWLSRHPPLPRQIAELKRLFGENTVIRQDVNPFSDVHDIVARFHDGRYDEIVVVAPLSLIARLCEAGITPLWAEMQPTSKPRAEIFMNNRHYRFVKFRRIKRIAIEFEELE
jgi:hypothetical protein